jgi:2-polyprenyl-6-hydroxyphenyl methylase/3-demethylubiquinone-9 3-methyltransferase
MNETILASEPTLRFGFGANWRRFLSVLTEHRIGLAQQSLKQILEVEDLKAKTFLDVGCGSGLFSLVARRLGARVYSFDYDPESVACARKVKDRYCSVDREWILEVGSALVRSTSNLWGPSTLSIRGAYFIIRETCGRRWKMFTAW